MKTLLFILSVALSVLLVSLVVNGAENPATRELQENQPKSRRIVLTNQNGSGDRVYDLFGEPLLDAVLPSHLELYHRAREMKQILEKRKRRPIWLLTRRLFELLREDDDRDKVFVGLRKLEWRFYKLFAKFPHITNDQRDGRVYMPYWVDSALTLILPYVKFTSGDGLSANLVRSVLIKHHDGVFYFSPLALFRMMISVEADISWRFTPAVHPVDNHSVLSEVEVLPRDVLLKIFNMLLVKKPHSFHLLRQVCRSFYHFNPLTSLSQHHSTDQAKLSRYLGLYNFAEPSVYLNHVHHRTLLFTSWSKDRVERSLCDYTYLMRDKSEGYLVLDGLASAPLDHERLTRQLQTYASDNLGALEFLVARAEELTLLIKNAGNMYAFLTNNRIFIDTIVGWCPRRFTSLPAPLQVALRNLFRSFAIYVVPSLRDADSTELSATANMKYLRNRSVLDLILKR